MTVELQTERTRDYLQHWGLQERPFESNRDIRFFYPGREHVEALERLLYLVKDGNMCFGLLTGEIGAGKTMVLNKLMERLGAIQTALPVHLPNGNLEFCDLLREMIYRMENRRGLRFRRGPRDCEGKYDLIARFQDLLEAKAIRLGRQLVLLIDEAQQLSEEALTELKNLTNIGAADRNFITIVLAGQPELSEVIRSLPAIDQRVGLRYHLACFDDSGTGAYLDYRMEAAGLVGGGVFDTEAKAEVHRQTAGIPREINRLCKLALDRTFALGERTVSAKTIRSIAADIHHQDAMS
ncbi:MAG: ExeA family protein [Planctomycetota bacterium]